MNDTPRRAYLDRLTEARDSVADYVDGVEMRRFVKSDRRERRIEEMEVENARMRAALEQIAEGGVPQPPDWVRALARTGLDGKIPLST